MTEPNNSSGGPPTPSSGAPRRSYGSHSRDKKVLGDLQVFGDLIYKLGNVNKANNAAELFTTEKFSDWSRTEHSHDIGNLVEFRQERDFKPNEPEIPSANT